MRVTRWFIILFFLIAIAGFIDSAYLAMKFYTDSVPPCSIVSGCEEVTTSQYASVFGISIALLGALYYASLIIGLVVYLDTRTIKVLKPVSLLTIVGFLVSLYLLYLQVFIIEAVCIYCLFSAATSISLFGLGAWFLRAHKRV